MSTPPAASSMEASHAIPDDLACVHCGYALRGLSSKGSCPECGTAIGRSLASDDLSYAPPRWLNTLRLGLALLIIHEISLLIYRRLIIAIAGPDRYWLDAAVDLGTLMLAVAGILLVSRREPQRAANPRWDLNRFVAICVIVEVATRLVRYALAGYLLYTAFSGPYDYVIVISNMTYYVSLLVMAAGWIAVLFILSRFAVRMKSQRLRDSTIIVMAIMCIITLLHITYSVLAAVFMVVWHPPRVVWWIAKLILIALLAAHFAAITRVRDRAVRIGRDTLPGAEARG